MFYDLQDISIPFAEYQISEEEKNDIKQRVKKLVDKYDMVDFSLEEQLGEELYKFYLINKNENEYVLICVGLVSEYPQLVYLTPNQDWVNETPLKILLRYAKKHPNTLCFHQAVYGDEELIAMAMIRADLHIYDMLPRDRDSEEYESAYIDTMQVLLMMLYDIDYKEIRKRNPKIDAELEDLFSIQYADPESYLERKFKKQFYIDGYSRFL